MNASGQGGGSESVPQTKEILLPVAALWALLVGELMALLALNDGRLIYTLDDPYIHLALAENLLNGHFGVNLGEASAPSSSILWPFLLAPFTSLELVEWVPLALNVLFATLTLLIIQRTFVLALRPGSDLKLRRAAVVATILAIPACNLVGLVFTGMEHSLQVLLAVLVAHGLLVANLQGKAPHLLLVAVVLGPLVRYESSALSGSAILWLWWTGERGRAQACTALILVFIGAYSFLLHSLGLAALPTSVLAKASLVATSPHENLSSAPGVLMALAIVALLAAGRSPRRTEGERRTALCISVGLVLHMLVGSFGWYSRYEIYAWSAGLLVVVFLWARPLSTWILGQSLLQAALFGSLVVGIACNKYVMILGSNAFASNNIYQQQFSMHRFLTEFWVEPVAVNDLGWTTFQNDQYVLDLAGLGSLEALEARRNSTDSSWVDPLVKERGIRAAMIYDRWFSGLPESWRRVGELRVGGPLITAADRVVAFYATDPAHLPELEMRLKEFEAVLPPGSSFVFEDEGGS